ncbi:hypothetical protein FOTG_16418 [Fusarium oxysporum f. sp. vasinfectum 25433]|uniref:Uncharacterized protein n=1 Tax=Fusarium oxysporum f. sp. vasinfectum 25433 TaxID=1089449 RepID=X0KNQ1_FUSOX|nr:hypothetical protein FOTG_16418 [Fusarium oxysporum f. sp. vasinfectum 25433]
MSCFPACTTLKASSCTRRGGITPLISAVSMW